MAERNPAGIVTLAMKPGRGTDPGWRAILGCPMEEAMRRLKTVIHAHTHCSRDSNIPPEELVVTAGRQGVDCVAVTDHNTIEGALAARAAAGPDLRVIVGEEISSADGHLIGLFLEQVIEPGLSGEETIARIREQGGIVLAPHPFATLCDSSLGRVAVERLVPLLDALEIHNAQNPLWWEDTRAARFARRHGLTAYVGADAHVRGYLAAAYQLIPDFDDPPSFLSALKRADLHRGRFGLKYVAIMAGRQAWDRVVGRPWGGFGANAAARPKRNRRNPKQTIAGRVRVG